MTFRLDFHTMPHRKGHIVDLLVPVGPHTAEMWCVATAYPRLQGQAATMPVLYDVHDIAHGGVVCEAVPAGIMLSTMYDLGAKHERYTPKSFGKRQEIPNG